MIIFFETREGEKTMFNGKEKLIERQSTKKRSYFYVSCSCSPASAEAEALIYT
jgi:hypothetical protein